MRTGIVSAPGGPVTVELLGMARFRAGCTELLAHGHTVGDVLRSVITQIPQLSGLITETGCLSRYFLVSLDCDRFADDLAEPVLPKSRLLILGADPGG